MGEKGDAAPEPTSDGSSAGDSAGPSAADVGWRERARTAWLGVAVWKRLVVVLAVVVGVPALVYLVRDPNGAGGATRECREQVEERLKAPASAEFGDTYDSLDDQGRWEIAGEVDSQNGFGAMVRNVYTCTVTRENGWWQLVSLEFAGD
ncbi:hypothetical protein ACNKF0_09540 [Nocardioides sp. T5]|uniref:hypothetical protein n=1 Tax=Nocardioides sp. T5 TaxID=3400182 RepID=UPI003A87B0D0